MAKNSIDVYGASGKTNVLNFEPENLHLVTDKTHPLYDEWVHLPIEEGMVLNIAELGVLEPIIVWKDPETGLTCVVVGRQRVKHTLEANKLRLKEGKDPLLVPGVVKRGSANQMAKYMVSENEIRRPDTPLGRAKKMSDQLDRGLDEDDIAVLFGCSVQTVRATLSLLDATQAVREAVEAGTVTVTQARQLASLKPEEQREKSLKSSGQQLVLMATKKLVDNARFSVKQSRVSNHAKKSQKPSKVPAVNTRRLCAGCLGRLYDNRKNPYRHRDHQRRSEGKKTAPDRADVGRRQKRVLPQRNRAPSLCRKYAPPVVVGND